MNFATAAFEFSTLREKFTDEIVRLASGEFLDIEWDEYDLSLEIIAASTDFRLNQECIDFILGNGFINCYVNHTDGWTTFYSERTKPEQPFRRRPNPERPGCFLVNFIPETWKDFDCQANGFITVDQTQTSTTVS